jgi:hypothetical protein
VEQYSYFKIRHNCSLPYSCSVHHLQAAHHSTLRTPQRNKLFKTQPIQLSVTYNTTDYMGKSFFSFHNIQNCSAAHPIGTELLAEVKRPEHAPCSKLRMSGAIPQLPLYGRTAPKRTTLSFLTFKQFVTLQCYIFLLVRSSFYSLISCMFLPLFLVFLFFIFHYFLLFFCFV